MSTPKFELPEKCPTCNSDRTEWNMSSVYGTTQEYARYKCRAYLSKYPSHQYYSSIWECPRSPKNLKIAERNREIDIRVLAVLKELKLTNEEINGFVIRTDRGRWDKDTDSIFKYL